MPLFEPISKQTPKVQPATFTDSACIQWKSISSYCKMIVIYGQSAAETAAGRCCPYRTLDAPLFQPGSPLFIHLLWLLVHYLGPKKWEGEGGKKKISYWCNYWGRLSNSPNSSPTSPPPHMRNIQIQPRIPRSSVSLRVLTAATTSRVERRNSREAVCSSGF